MSVIHSGDDTTWIAEFEVVSLKKLSLGEEISDTVERNVGGYTDLTDGMIDQIERVPFPKR